MNGTHLRLIDQKRSLPGAPLSVHTDGSHRMRKRLFSVQDRLLGNALLPAGARHRNHEHRFGHDAAPPMQGTTSSRAKQSS